MENIEKVFKRIESNREEMVALQKRLCAIPAIAPESGGAGESRKAEAITDWLREHFITSIETINVPDERVPSGIRPNIIATIAGKTEQRFWIMTHMDIVPPGELSLWQGNPFKAWRVSARPTTPTIWNPISSR